MNQQAEKGFQYVHPVHWFQCCSRFSNLQLDVIDTKETREFTVQVQSEVFRPAGLKLQEGPDICFARLKQELQGETQEAPAEAHLGIGQQDVREYLEQHYPAPPLAKKTGSDR